MFRRRASSDQPEALIDRLDAIEAELQRLRREAAELRATHDDLIELALINAVPNTIQRIISDARGWGWRISYSREPHNELYGSICFEHPTDPVHNCSIKLPLPEDPAERRKIESEIGMRIRWSQAA
jgi:hypothetical protein